MDFKKKFLGFTLAEVLITIGIIGIIAEVTIPTIVMNTQRQEFVTLFQKNYSNVQNMLKMYMSEQGTDNLGLTNLFDGSSFADTGVQNELDNLVNKYFKVIKICRRDTGDSSCAITERYFATTTTATYASGSNYYAFITNDGIETFIIFSSSCSPDFTKPGKIKANCGGVLFDVNGAKSPNTFGKDFFMTFIINYDGTLYPIYGQEYATYTNNSNNYWKNNSSYCGTTTIPVDTTGASGMGCAARIMENSWKIDYW